MSPAHFQHIRLSLAHDVVLVEILSVDVQGPERALEFSTELNQVAADDCARPLLVDLSRARYLSSMGYAALFKLVKQAKERQRPVRFCNMHPDVRVGAEIVGLTRVVAIDDSVQSALEAFAQPCAATAGVATPSRIAEDKSARGAAALKAYSWEPMIAAVAAARDRAARASAALQQAGIAHVVAGGHAVAAWVAQVDPAAVPNPKDVELLVCRRDWPRVLEVLPAAGFVHQLRAGAHRFLDGPGGSARSALRIVFAGEKARPDDLLPAPEVTETEAGPDFPVLPLEALVRMQLSSFGLKDKVHLLALLEAGLIDDSWRCRLAPELAARLEELAAERDSAA
jgi:anti-anti-sigma factor